MNVLIGLVGYSDVRINSVFKKNYGMTPIEYLHQVRLQKAKELMEKGVPIGMAAYRAGYGSQRTFYRVFAKHTGMSPGEYKQSIVIDYDSVKDMVKRHECTPIEYAHRMCETIMFECAPTKLPPMFSDMPQSQYTYVNGMFLLGMYRIYQWCGDERYLNYICEWIETVTEENGLTKETYEHPRSECGIGMDVYQPLRLFMEIYDETGLERCSKTIEHFFGMLKDAEKTKSGIYVHHPLRVRNSVFLNSVYMLCPTMCMYAQSKGKSGMFRIAADQAIAMYMNMCNEHTGLLCHAWDETMKEEWADPETGLSNVVWGRGLAYYCMGILDMLDYIPAEHRCRKKLISIVKDVLIAVSQYQDKSGRWYQLIEKNNLEDNWLENSCTCMFAYSFAKAINTGILGKEYAKIAISAYCGIIDDIEYNENGDVIYVKNICNGMNVGGQEMYIEATKSTNDLHGMGAFIQMCCEIERLLNSL